MSGFQLKDFVSIVAAQVNHARATQDKLTDFEIGSVVRTLMEAPAIEIEELYQKIFAGVLDAIPTAIYKAFDFELIAKAAASGSVRITFSGPIVEEFTIPAGTVFDCAKSPLKFTSTADVVIPVGAESAAVVVVCVTAGTIGNVAAGSITGSPGYTLPVGSRITNDAFTSGVDAQTDAERKARFVEFIQSLSRGTVAALRYAVRQAQLTNAAGQLLEYVARVGVEESPGHVAMYIYGSGGMASAELLAKAQAIIDGYFDAPSGKLVSGYRAGGVKVDVLPMGERRIPVGLKVKVVYGVDLSPESKKAIKNDIATALAPEFESVESGDTLFVGQITEAALAVPSLQGAICSNELNERCAETEVLRLGDLSVEYVNA